MSETDQHLNVFAGFRSSYRPPIELPVPVWQQAKPVNDVGSEHDDSGTSHSLVNQQRYVAVATRPTSSSRLITVLAAILSRVSGSLWRHAATCETKISQTKQFRFISLLDVSAFETEQKWNETKLRQNCFASFPFLFYMCGQIKCRPIRWILSRSQMVLAVDKLYLRHRIFFCIDQRDHIQLII